MEIVILNGARTPFGKFGGGLKDISATELGVLAVNEALQRSQIKPEQVDHVIMGNVAHSSPDAAYLARHVGIKAGVPIETPALTLNRLCGSGLQSVITAAQHILLNEAKVVVAGGAENMSQIPYVLSQARWGYRMGNAPMIDMLSAALTDTCAQVAMSDTAENLAEKYAISREEQDVFALRSQQLATAARDSGRLAQEIVPVQLNDKKKTVVAHDEHMRPDTSAESLAKLPAAFRKNGSVTAGNASGINDGAGAVVVTSREHADSLGLQPMARVCAWATVGVPPEIMGIGPAPAIRQAVEKAGLTLDDIDLFEVNEAFAAQYLAVEKELGLDRNKVNVNGGAIAIGHPLGASGTRVLLTLLYELKARGLRYGVASLCIGGGQGIAMVVENLA